jgi:dTDP-4-amino-4,6-dideoxygalactose transaminase
MSTISLTPVRFVDLRPQIQSLEPALTEAIRGVLDRGDFVLGAEVDRFESDYAAYCGARQAVGTDSGLSALELALRAAEIGPGDEVITQANTFIATAGAILAVGARPVLVDCGEDGQIDISAVTAAVTPRTKAIIPVHLFGCICDIDGILRIAQPQGLVVIEDACQAHGATLRGQRAGTFGNCGAFSFYPGKNLGCFGDGGMLVSNDGELAAAARTLRNYGSKVKYEHIALPLNHRLDTIQAAVLRVKLPHLDDWNARRQYLADAYREHFTELPISLPARVEEGRHVYHLFVIQADDRDTLRSELASEGIETGIHYPIPLHRQPVLANLGYRSGAFPYAERLAARSVSLPMFPELTVDQLERIANAVRRHYMG